MNKYLERNPKEIIQIDTSKKLVTINLKFETGLKSYLGDILVTGNEETKDIVIKRELKTKKGEIVTPSMINEYINRLRSLGLFSSVDVSPFIGKNIIGYLITNTRFTEDAINYSNCENVHLISWDYPQKGSLKDLIELSGLYPISCLTTLKSKEKSMLLEKGIVMAKDLVADPKLLDQFKASDYRKTNILNELNELCNP